MSTALATTTGQAPALFQPTGSIFLQLDKLDQFERIADKLSKSTFIPKAYQGKPEECLIALDYAGVVGVSVLTVMQNLHVVEGLPSWRSTFVIAAIRASRRFRSVRFITGQEGVIPVAWINRVGANASEKVENLPNITCYVLAVDTESGEEIKGSTVTMRMAVDEGWYMRKGSKWVTMPEQMLQYRAATFFSRIHLQDVLLGMQSEDEAAEISAYPYAQSENGTGAVEIMEGVTGDAPRPRQRRQGAAAPTPVVSPNPGPTPAPEVGETQVGEYVDSEPVAEPVSAPVATPEPSPIVEPAPAAEAPVQGAPAAQAAPAAKPAEVAPWEFNAETMSAMLKLAKDPVVGNLSESEAAELKAFAAHYPHLVTVPRTRRGKVEFSQEGLEWLGDIQTPAKDTPAEVEPSGLPLADSEDLEHAAEAEATAAGDVSSAPVMTAQPGGAAPAVASQAAHSAKVTEQYGPEAVAPGAMLGPDGVGKFHAAGSEGAKAAWPLTGNPVTERAAAAEQAATATDVPAAPADTVSDLFDM